MKKVFCCILIFSLILPCSFAFAENRNVAVYRTETGDCYHSFNCSYLISCIKISLEDAVRCGLRRCSFCNPPIPDFDVSFDRSEAYRQAYYEAAYNGASAEEATETARNAAMPGFEHVINEYTSEAIHEQNQKRNAIASSNEDRYGEKHIYVSEKLFILVFGFVSGTVFTSVVLGIIVLWKKK